MYCSRWYCLKKMPKLTNAGDTKQSEDPEFENNENGHMHTCLEGWQFNNDQVIQLTVSN